MTSPANEPVDEQIDEILQDIFAGLTKFEKEQCFPEAKAAFKQLIAQERIEARIDELEYLISDPPIFGKTLHTDLFGLAPAIDDNWSETKDAGYNNGMREAQNRVKRRIAALRAEGK
ncbi:MAG TPA: hypothetical protein VGN15_11890 [Ktedonobacteraceae bacterium]|jgi:hypothetical protein|nr:hypothetical protein [Ktedonobacteraceae bacterium]